MPVHLKSIPSLSLAFPPFLSPPLSRDLSRVQMLDANATLPQPLPHPSPPPITNGLHCDHPPTDADSPIADSPDTPVNTVSDVAVKITSDVPEVESDVRHEPFQISLSKLDDASIGQIDTPIDPGASLFPLFSFITFIPRSTLLRSNTNRTSSRYVSTLASTAERPFLTPPSRPSRGCRDGRC